MARRGFSSGARAHFLTFLLTCLATTSRFASLPLLAPWPELNINKEQRQRETKMERARERGRLQRDGNPIFLQICYVATVQPSRGIVVRFNHAPSAILRSTLGHVSAFPVANYACLVFSRYSYVVALCLSLSLSLSLSLTLTLSFPLRIHSHG